jgi:transcriptional regulator with XRE-family HTH domain
MTNIASLRKQLGWSQEKMARKVDLSLGSVLNVEHGAEFNSTTVRAFASGLGIKLEKAFALCASTLGTDELALLAAEIGGSHATTKELPDVKGGKGAPSKEAPKRSRARASRVAVHP